MYRTKKIILSKQQREIMQLFYAVVPTEIILPKREYDKLWKTLTKKKTFSKQQAKKLINVCPAIVCEIQKSIAETHHIQSAVFSECVSLRHWQIYLNCRYSRIMRITLLLTIMF